MVPPPPASVSSITQPRTGIYEPDDVQAPAADVRVPPTSFGSRMSTSGMEMRRKQPQLLNRHGRIGRSLCMNSEWPHREQ